MKKILIVDDEKDIRFILNEILTESGYSVSTLGTIKEAENYISQNVFDLALLDVLLDEKSRDGLYLLNLIKNKNKNLPVIMMSGHANIQIAVNSVKDGAFEFLEKPFNQERLLNFIRRAIEYSDLLNKTNEIQENIFKSFEFIGKNKDILNIKDSLPKAANSDGRILIEGSSGTGKELLAREIHKNSKRFESNFVILDAMKINKINFDETLYGKIIDGNVYTGVLEKANQGTLFIDNINELSLDIQNKLLRVITDQRFKRVNDITETKVNFRLICSSSILLKNSVSNGNFREDLYHRINVIYFHLPDLNKRSSDIPILANYFYKIFKGEKYDISKYILDFSPFYNYEWPGNVRELRNLVERLSIMGGTNIEKFKNIVYEYFNPTKINNSNNNNNNTDLTLKEARDNFEKQFLMTQLKKFDGNISKTAEAIGMERTALHRKLSLLNIKN